MKKILTSWIGAVLLAALLTLNGQTAGAQSLDSCYALARRHSLTVRAAEKQVERAEALQGTAFNLPATSISLSQDFTNGGSPDNGLTVSQEFSLPSVYSARRKQLRAETELERRQLAVTEQTLRQQVASAYWTLVYQRERIRLLTAQDSIYRQFEQLAAGKYRGGDVSRLEQLNAERLRQDNLLALKQARIDGVLAETRLNQLTGKKITPQDGELRTLDGPDGFFISGWNESANDSLWRSGVITSFYDQQETVARQRLNSVRKESLPTFNIGVTGQLLIKGLNPYNIERERFREGDLMAVEVGVSLPLTFGATKAKRRAAQADVELAELQRQQMQRELDNQTQLLFMELVQAAQSVEYYNMYAREKVADIAHTSEVRYRYGEIDYVEHSQNLQTAITAALSHADAVQQYNQAIIKLNTLQ